MTACSPTCATPNSPTSARRLDRAARGGRPPDGDARDARRRRPRPDLLPSEFAVAVAGWALEINPFDQPNVQEAKDNTKQVLDSGSVPSVEPSPTTMRCGRCWPTRGRRHYVAILGYLPPSDELDAAIARAAGGDPRGHRRGGRRSATARGSSTRPARSTRAARRTAGSCSSSTRPSAMSISPAPGYSFGTLIAAAGGRRPGDAAVSTGCRPSGSSSRATRPRRSVR